MTLNAQNYLGQTIDSVLKQDYPNIEYIFIDGCSRDRTMEIINEKCPAAMKKVIQEPGNGTSQAMNKGFEMASGKYVWALNADDMLASEDTLSKLVQYMETALDCDFVFGDMAMIDEKGAVIGKGPFLQNTG